MNGFVKLWNNLVAFVAELSPSCRWTTRWLSEAFEQPPSLRRRLGLRMHLALCKWCRRYRDHLGFARRAAGWYGEDGTRASTARLPTDARTRIKRILQTEKDNAPD